MIHKIIVVVFLFMIAVILWFGLYPVATVNFNPVFKRDFDAKFELSKNYLIGVAQEQGLTEDQAGLFPSDDEIELEVLNSMVQEKLIEELAKKDFSSEISDIKKTVEENINKEMEDSSKVQALKQAGQILSGTEQTKGIVDNFMKPAEFIRVVSEKVTASGRDFASWYKENAAKAHVYVFLPQYTWSTEDMSVLSTKSEGK